MSKRELAPHMTRSQAETAILDKTSELLSEDSDTFEALDSFARDWISERELIDRLVFLKRIAKERAERLVLGPAEPDDCEAREGTWDDERPEAEGLDDDEHATNPGAA